MSAYLHRSHSDNALIYVSAVQGAAPALAALGGGDFAHPENSFPASTQWSCDRMLFFPLQSETIFKMMFSFGPAEKDGAGGAERAKRTRNLRRNTFLASLTAEMLVFPFGHPFQSKHIRVEKPVRRQRAQEEWKMIIKYTKKT